MSNKREIRGRHRERSTVASLMFEEKPQFSRLRGGPVSRSRGEDLENTMAPVASRHAFHAAKATAATKDQRDAERDRYNLQNPRSASPG